MTLPLRAYLMLRAGDGSWSVSVFRGLDEVLNAWTAEEVGTWTGVLHVGFDRPASQMFEDLAIAYPGRMLLTGAMRYALPQGFESSRRPVGRVSGFPMFLALRGWGYILSEDLDLTGEETALVDLPEPEGWLRTFLDAHPEYFDALRAERIFDEASYVANEAKLQKDLRHILGLARYRSLVRAASDEPREILLAAPPWLLDKPLESFNLTVRVSNAFISSNIGKVTDLLAYDTLALLRIPNFGRKSVNDLRSSLLEALNDGPLSTPSAPNEDASVSLLDELDRSLASLEDRERDILCRRMGLGKIRQTLQEIGEDYGITRERIRQIESKVLDKIVKSKNWPIVLVTRLESLLLGRDFPLPVLGIEAVDPWFKGVGKASSMLKYVLSNICDDKLEIVEIGEVEYVGRINQEAWTDKLSEARRLLASGANDGWTEQHCRTLIESLLGESKREFRPVLWQAAGTHCHFVDTPEGRTLASYGRGAEQLVEAVLRESSDPLHFSELARRVSERSGKEIDPRRVHNAAATIGILLGRGIYGLQQHIQVSDGVRDLLRDEIEQVILNGPDDRQWHTTELLAVAVERGIAEHESFDRYVIDYILSTSPVLQRLGRMVWSKAASSLAARIDVRQAVTSLLQRAGTPLSTTEIRQRLVALRGLGSNFQIVSTDMVVRIRAGYWGLNDRDLPLKKADQASAIEQMVAGLVDRACGVHVSEMRDFVRDWLACADEITPEALFSLASLDARLQISSSDYLFLKEWREPRRITMSTAIDEILASGQLPLTTAEIVAAVEQKLQRSVNRRDAVLYLQASEAILDPSTNLWSTPSPLSDGEVPEVSMPSRTLLAPISWAS